MAVFQDDAEMQYILGALDSQVKRDSRIVPPIRDSRLIIRFHYEELQAPSRPMRAHLVHRKLALSM